MRFGTDWSVSDHSSSNPASVCAISPSMAGRSAAKPGRWNTTRWKYAPPVGSSEYWSNATMLPPMRVIIADTAATIPGRSLPCTMRQAWSGFRCGEAAIVRFCRVRRNAASWCHGGGHARDRWMPRPIA